nr:TPA_asm: hypothetical protein [Phagomor virus 5]
MASCNNIYPTVERRETESATTDKCESSTSSLSALRMSVFKCSVCKCEFPTLPSRCTVCKIDTVFKMKPRKPFGTECVVVCNADVDAFADIETPLRDETLVSTLVACSNSVNLRVTDNRVRFSETVRERPICQNGSSLVTANLPEVRAPVINLSLTQQPNDCANTLVFEGPCLSQRMNDLDFALSDGTMVRENRAVECLYDNFFNTRMSVATAAPGTYFSLSFNHLSSLASVYIYRNTLRIGHLSTLSTYMYSFISSSGTVYYDSYPIPDFSSPVVTDCYHIDILPLSRLYTRYIAPDSFCTFSNLSKYKMQLPIVSRFTDRSPSCASTRQLTITDIPDFSELYIHRYGDYSLYLSLKLTPTPAPSRPIAQVGGPSTTVITPCEEEPADKFPVSFKRKNVHRHIVALCDGLQKPFWKFILNLDEIIVMKYACVMADVCALYCDFSQVELAIKLFSFNHLSSRQTHNRQVIVDCLWGKTSLADYPDILSSSPLAQGLFDFTVNHKTDFSDVLKGLTDRVDFIGQRLFDVQQLFDTSIFPNYKTSLRVFLVALISNIYILTHDVALGVRIAACVNIINTIPVGTETLLSSGLLRGLMAVASFFDTRRNVVTAQVDSPFPAEGIITSVVQVILGFLKSSDDKLVKIEDFRVKRLINLLKLSSFSVQASSFAQTLYTKIMDVVNVYMFGVTNTDEFYSSLHGDLPAWLRGCLRFELSVDEDDKVKHPLIDLSKYENKLDLIRHVSEGERIMKVLVASDVMSKYARVITYVGLKLNNLKKLMQSIGATLVGMQGKHSPFVIFIHGKPGLGKSMMVDFFLSGLYACNNEKYDPCLDKFSKSATTQYWNGYDSHKVYLIDDFLQSKDETMCNESLADLIALGSRAPFPLNKADVESKGCSFFNSEVVIVTAQMEFSDKYYERFVMSGMAIQRRLDVCIEVMGNPAMCDKTGKIDSNLTGPGFNQNACTYRMSCDKFVKENLSFTDLVIECAVLKHSKKIVERQLDDCKIANINWNDEFVKRRNTVQMYSPGSSSTFTTTSEPEPALHSTRNEVLNTYKSMNDLPDLFSTFTNRANPSVSHSLNSLPSISDSDPLNIPLPAYQPYDIEHYLDSSRYYFEEPSTYTVSSSSIPELPEIDDFSSCVSDTSSDSELLRDLDNASIARALVDDREPELVTEYGKSRWARIREAMHKAITTERDVLRLAVDRQDLAKLFKSKLVVGFLSTQAVIVSIFALYKIFSHFRTRSASVPKDRVQKDVNIAVRARNNEQTKIVAESRDFTECDIDWLYKRALDIADKEGLGLNGLIKTEEERKMIKRLVQKKLNDDLNDRLNDVVNDDIVYDAETYAEVARGIRHAKYQDNDPTKPRRVRRNIRQAMDVNVCYDDLKLKVSSFDDARNRDLITQLTSSDFIEECCDCCERYYLYECDCPNPLECPYADCESNRERTNKPDKLQLHSVNRAALLAEILEKNRYGLPLCESARDPQLMTILELTRNNLVRVKNVATGNVLCGLIIDSDIVCFPLHLFVGRKDYGDMYLEINSSVMQKYIIKLCDTKYIIDEKRDLMFLQLIKFPLRRSLVKFFHQNDDRIEYYDSGYIAKITDNSLLTLLSINSIEISGKLEYFFSDSPIDSRRVVIDSHANYNADTVVGDCGAPVFYVNRAFSRKILGIHVAGSTGKGMSNIMTQEYLESMLEQFKRFVKAHVGFEGCYDSSRVVRDTDVVQLLGRVEHGIGKPGNTVSAFVPSLIHDAVVKHTTKPCMLRPDGDIDPLRLGVVKAFKPDTSFPNWILETAISDVIASVRTLQSEYSRIGLLDDSQNINGDFIHAQITGINLNSSSGYPWNLFALDGKKRFFLGEDHDLRMGPLLERTVRRRENDLKLGIIPPFIMTDTLKDERREISKVDAGKTRVFSAGPLDMTILVRKYYGSFVAHLMDNCILGECSVGLNVHGDDWGLMFSHLESVGDHWIAGDYAAFDKRLPYQVMMGVCDVVNAWYDDSAENQRVREGLMISMASSMHLADHVVYDIHHGMPSGVPITAVGNSVANSIMFRMAFLDIANDLFGEVKALQLFSDFNLFVRLVAYGDDHILRVSDSVKWFNMISISKFFAKYGMEYTTTSKTAAQEEFVQDDDLMYLCRRFVKRDGRMWAPLEMKTINEMLNWTRKSALGDHLALQTNIDMALIEMSHYSRLEWQSFYNKLIPVLSRKHISVPRLTYQICLHLVSGYVFDPAYILGLEASITGSRPVCEMGAVEQVFLRKVKQEIDKYHKSAQAVVDREDIVLPTQLKRTTLGDAPVTIRKVKPRTSAIVQSAPCRAYAQVGTVLSNDVDRANADDPTVSEGLTTFSDQSGTVIVENNSILGKLSSLTVYGSQTLTEFISRPYLVQQIEWKSTDAGMISYLEFPTELFAVTALADKLSNFRYLRADLRISIRVNASKFHYGKIIAAWKPHYLNGMANWDSPASGNGYEDVFSTSAFQHILISPTSSEVHTMVVPYALPDLYIDMYEWAKKTNAANVRYNLGNLELHVLAPLRCGGKTPSVDISVFANFENVQVEGYVGQTFILNTYEVTKYHKPAVFTDVTNYVNLLDGWYKKKVPTARAIAQVGNSEANKKASAGSFSDVLTGGAALIGAVTTAATLVSKLGGFTSDKPVSTETQKRIITSYPDTTLGRGVAISGMLAIDPDNRVADLCHWMGSQPNNMDLNVYAGRYGLLWDTTITVTDVAGTIYCCLPVTPALFPYWTQTAATEFLLYSHPLGWISNMFTWWRGSIKFKVQIIASAFHACRLRVCWHPAVPIMVGSAKMLETESNVVSHVLDVSTDTELEFTIPFLNEHPVLRCGPKVPESNGYISLSMINTLTHATDPVPDISVLLWVAGGDDMEFYRPTNRCLSNYPFKMKAPAVERPIAQVGQAININGSDRALAPAKVTVLENMICGEKIVSVLDLAKRPYGFAFGLVKATSGAFGRSFSPNFTSELASYSWASHLAYLMGGFRFWRGSFNYQVLKQSDAAYWVKNDISFLSGTTVVKPDVFKPADCFNCYGDGLYYSPASKFMPVDVCMPYYSSQLFQPTNFSRYSMVVDAIPTITAMSVTANSDDQNLIAAGDDFAFGGIIGPPTCYVLTKLWF